MQDVFHLMFFILKSKIYNKLAVWIKRRESTESSVLYELPACNKLIFTIPALCPHAPQTSCQRSVYQRLIIGGKYIPS
jgi:hypothetical protein